MIEFKLPALGENIEQGDLVRLMIAPGSAVTEGETIMELETDKAVVEVPSSVTGIVKDVKVKEGEKIKVGQVIFTAESNRAAAAAARGRGRVVASAKDFDQAASNETRPAKVQPSPPQTAPHHNPNRVEHSSERDRPTLPRPLNSACRSWRKYF